MKQKSVLFGCVFLLILGSMQLIPPITAQHHNGSIPPAPGAMTNEPSINMPTSSQSHTTVHLQPTTMKDDIVDLLLKINETIVLSYLENITAFGPRVTGSSAIDQAALYLYDEFASMGLNVMYHHWNNSGYSGKNVVATLEGKNEGSYIICAHYDSVSGSPGADDDASGVVATLCAAYVLQNQQFNHSIQFIAFSGEEQGLLGSAEYAQQAAQRNDSILGVLNADMIGFATTADSGQQLQIYYDEPSEWLVDFTDSVSSVYQQYINLSIVYAGYSWRSDHFSFWENGYNAIFYHEYEFNTNYHTPDDIIENMNSTYLTKTCRLLLATLVELSLHQTTSLQITTVQGGIRPSFLLTNNGDFTTHNISWTTTVNGGILNKIDITQQGSIPHLHTNGSETITLQTIVGFGFLRLSITADAAFAEQTSMTVPGFNFFFYTVLFNPT